MATMNVIYSSDSLGILEVTLIADPGYEVVVGSVDLAGFENTDRSPVFLDVFNERGTKLFDASVDVEGDFDGARHSRVDFGARTSRKLRVRISTGALGSNSANVV